MDKKVIREWKKVFVSDLSYISYELKEIIKPKSAIFLEGNLGVGKTTFVKNFIGEDHETSSPSYGIVYETGPYLHADFYRVKTKEEIFQIELPLYLEDKNYLLIEWGKKFVNTINREIPENYSLYEMEIIVNSNSQDESEDKKSFSRNFILSELEDI